MTVEMRIDVNPGIAGLRYDFTLSEGLELTGLAKGVITDTEDAEKTLTPTTSLEQKLIIADSEENNRGIGTLVILTVKVRDDVAAGAKLTISAVGEDDSIFDVNFDNVPHEDTPCTITVAGGGENPNVSVTGVTLDKTTLELTEGQEGQLTATVAPETATIRTVKWTSDSEQVTVDENGKVKALYYTAGSTGKATITVTTDDGGYTDVCEVTVQHGKLTCKPYEAASCTKEGHQAYWFCDTCKHYYTDVNGAPGEETTSASVIIPTSPHTLEPVAEKAATCTTGGNNAYWTCSACGKAFKDDNGSQPTTVEAETLDALGHDYTVTGHDDTNHWKACSRCNEKDASSVAAHTLVVVVKKTYADGSPTHEVKCSVCGALKNEDHEGDDITTAWEHDENHHWHVYGCGTIMNKEAHTWDTGTVTKAATCTEKGERTYTCDKCGREKTEENIPAKGHQKVLNKTDAIPATCTTGGNDAYWTCPDCGTYFSDEGGQNVIEKDSWITEKLGHKYTDESLRVTWGGDGKSAHIQLTCANSCGTPWSADVTLDNGITAAVKTPATCTEVGSTTYTAKVTNPTTGKDLTATKDVQDIPALGHDYTDDSLKALWTPDGKIVTVTFTCSRNGKHLHTLKLELEKNDVTAAVKIPATCTEMGTTTYTAKVTNPTTQHEFTLTKDVQDIALLPHTMVKTEDKAATCVAAGNNAYWTCSVCKGVFKDELGKTATTVEAETLPIDPANHTGNTELRDAVTATCNMSGHEADTYCKDCGVLLSRGATIPATGKHTYGEDGRCTSCGNVNPTAGVNTDDIKAADTVNGKPVSPDNSGKVIASDDGKTVIKTPAAADDNTVQQVKDALTGGSVTLYVDNRKTEALTGSDGGVAALEALAASASGERKQELEKLAEALKALLSDSGRKNAAGQMVYDGEMQLCDANGVPVAELVQSPNSIQVTLPITEAQYQAMQGKKVCVLRSSTDASGAAAVTELSATVGGSQGARVLSFSTDKGGALALTVYETVSSGGSSGGSGSSTAPRTADAGVTVWCALLGISALLGTALVAKKRRQA